MRAPIRITEADLRSAMREPRYWQDRHPERDGFRDWVRGGFQALNPRDGEARGSVWVRAYVRNGHPVAGHWRAAPPSSGSEAEMGSKGEADGDAPLVPVSLRRFLDRILRGPADGRGGTTRRDAMRRDRGRLWQDGEGRDRVQELRNDTGSGPAKRLRDEVEQRDRPGGPSLRQRDLERLGVEGEPQVLDGGAVRYRLRDGRVVTLRSSSSQGNPPTMEIAEPSRLRKNLIPTDKFRYRPTD